MAAPATPVPATPPQLDVGWPAPGARVPRTIVIEGTIKDPPPVGGPTSAFTFSVFLEPGRDLGGHIVANQSSVTLDGARFRMVVTVPPGEHTLDIHARSTATGREAAVQIPIIAE